MEHKPTGYYLDYNSNILSGVSNGIRRKATQLNNDSIVWDDGATWKKTKPYSIQYYLSGNPWASHD